MPPLPAGRGGPAAHGTDHTRGLRTGRAHHRQDLPRTRPPSESGRRDLGRSWQSAGSRWCCPSRQLLEYLRGLGLVPGPKALAPVCRIDRLVTEFRGYLVRERGLTAGSGTVRDYRRVARQFLSDHIDPDGALELTAGEVTGFVLAQCRRLTGARSRKLVVTALRQLLRFLYLEGLTAGDLTGAVPLVAGRRRASLPQALDRQCVGRLLASCDRGRPAGRRDFAILLTLTRLGLRGRRDAAR